MSVLVGKILHSGNKGKISTIRIARGEREEGVSEYEDVWGPFWSISYSEVPRIISWLYHLLVDELLNFSAPLITAISKGFCKDLMN